MADFGFVGASYVAPSIYQDAQEDVNRLYVLTQISELKFEKEYIFELSEHRTEMTLITGLKLLEQYLSN